MEVIFEIEYRTEWGQRLVWCSGERRIAMEYRSDGVWRCRTTLAAGDVEYGYEVEADGRTIRREWRPHRQVIPQRGAERMSVCDRWSDRPTDAPFYTSAFTRAIFARPADGKPFDEGHGRLELQVEAPTVRPDEVLAIAGNAPELGGWQRFVALDDSDFRSGGSCSMLQLRSNTSSCGSIAVPVDRSCGRRGRTDAATGCRRRESASSWPDCGCARRTPPHGAAQVRPCRSFRCVRRRVSVRANSPTCGN